MPGTLTITIESANLTRDTDLIGKMDPYVRISCGQDVYQTKVAKDMGKHPVWNEVFTFKLLTDDLVRFELYDKDMIKSDDRIAEGVINLAYLQPGNTIQEIPLEWHANPAGFLKAQVIWIPFGGPIVAGTNPFAYAPVSGGMNQPNQMPPAGRFVVPGWAPPPMLDKKLIKSEANQVFWKWDANHDGAVGPGEFYPAFTDLCRRLGTPPPTLQQIENIASRVDKNQDGNISQREFIHAAKLIYGHTSKKGSY